MAAQNFISEMFDDETDDIPPDPWDRSPFGKFCFRWWPIVALLVAIALSHILGGSS